MELRVRRDLEERSKRLAVELERSREKARTQRERAKLASAAATGREKAVEPVTAPADVGDSGPGAGHPADTDTRLDTTPAGPAAAHAPVLQQTMSGSVGGELDWRTPTKASLQSQPDEWMAEGHVEHDGRDQTTLCREDQDILQHAAFLGVDTALALRSPSLSSAGHRAKAGGSSSGKLASKLWVAAEAEAALLPLARDALMTPTAALPNGWGKVQVSEDMVDCETGAGGAGATGLRFCYKNATSGEISWEHPVDAAARLAIQAKRDALLEVELDVEAEIETEAVAVAAAKAAAKAVGDAVVDAAAERAAMSRADAESWYALELPARQLRAQDDVRSFAAQVRDRVGDSHVTNSSQCTTGSADENEANSPSPSGDVWEECWDAEHNHPFWFNTSTGISTWERPVELGDDASTSSSDYDTGEGAGVFGMERADNPPELRTDSTASTPDANADPGTNDTADAGIADEVRTHDGVGFVAARATGQPQHKTDVTKHGPPSPQPASVDVSGGGLQDTGAVGLHCPPSAPQALALDGYGSVCAGCACPIDDGHGFGSALRTAQDRADCANCGLGFCVECLLHAGRLSFYAQYCAGAAANSLQPVCTPCYEHLQRCCAIEGRVPGQMPRFARHFELASARGIPRRCGFWRAALPPGSGKVVGRPLSAPRVVFSEHCLRCGSNTRQAVTQGMGLFQSMLAAAVGVGEELHCRACGYSFCHRCLPHMLSLPFCQYEDQGPQLVCVDCFNASQSWVG